MKTIKSFALILVIMLFTANTGNAQDQKSEGDYVWAGVVIEAECLPEAITGDVYVHWTSFKSLYREDAYGTFTGESGAVYYCNWTFSFRFNATHDKGGILHYQWITFLRKEGENKPVAKLHIMGHMTWANDELTASIDKVDVICMGK